MTDVVEPAVRSVMMSSIRSKNTQPELVLRRGLFSRGVRYRLHPVSLPGRPDIVIQKRKVAIMVHGCFWHAHEGCRFFRIPEGNRQFWVEKLSRNKVRDCRSVENLKSSGWRVAVVWECATRVDAEATLDAVHEFLTGSKEFVEIAGDKIGNRVKIRLRMSKSRRKRALG